MRSIGGRFQLAARALATPGDAGARLRRARAERPQQDAAADDVLALRRLPVVVEGVAGELLAAGRVEGDVEQLRAVAVGAEHVERHETRPA